MTVRYAVKVILLAVSISTMLTACSTEDTGQSQTTSIGHLVLTFKSNRSRVKMGDTVQMRFTVTNTGRQLIVIESNDRPVLDIVVSALPTGDVIRSWSTENPDKVSHRIEWKPGEAQVLEMMWTVSPGDKLGIRISLSGDVNSDSTILKSSGVMLCLEGFCP
jgi:hypothetical protein